MASVVFVCMLLMLALPGESRLNSIDDFIDMQKVLKVNRIYFKNVQID
jgi:hypothetical protein